MTILRIFLVILLINIIKYTKLVRFLRLICRIVDFSSLLIIEVIAKNVKNINFTFLQICKKKTGKYFLFMFLAITSILSKLEKHTI